MTVGLVFGVSIGKFEVVNYIVVETIRVLHSYVLLLGSSDDVSKQKRLLC